MRNTFISELEQLRSNDPRIQLLVGDLGFSVVEKFQDRFPESFHNIGVAEQNMIGIAAGMASEGLLPFCYSIANFPLFRPAEFIRNLVDYHDLNVSIIAVGGGLAYGNLGYTHHAIQDFSLINSFNNFTIIAPSDPSQISIITNFIYQQNTKPKYIRLNRNGEENIPWKSKFTSNLPYFQIDAVKADSVVISTGIAGFFVERYLKTSMAKGKYPKYHINFPIWGSQYKEHIANILSNFNDIFIFEDHIRHGGFANWIQSIGVKGDIKAYSMVEKYIGQVGTQEYFMKKYLQEELIND